MTLENARFRWAIRVILGNSFFAFECGEEATVVTLVLQEREDIADAFAEHGLAAEAGDALHRAVPRDDAAVVIEREHAVDARVDQLVEQ